MTTTLPRAMRLLVLSMATLLLLSACGSDSEGASGGALAEYDLSGLEIAVGSKDFTEQLVLGEIMVAAFEAAGADVDNKVNLGGTVVAREALLNGDIDVYMEYNGTGWTVHLGQEEPSFDPDELTEGVRALDLEQNDIRWVSRSPFNNTYGFASSPALTEENGGVFTMQEMADHMAANPETVLCLESEFPDRPDGLILFEEATGYTVPESQVTILDLGLIYGETAEGNCDFGEVFTTDGRILELNLGLVEDPGVMILYNVSMTVRDDLYQEAPTDFDAIADLILSPLDNELMSELNKRVAVDGENPEDVAADYLVSQGLIDG
jgi:osmoprotectant transport system substrate-binding protein